MEATDPSGPGDGAQAPPRAPWARGRDASITGGSGDQAAATGEPHGSPARLPHAPGLDGLRGLAVAAVVAFHAGPVGWLPGGFLGVSLFFTLSGYLIGSLVLAEVAATRTLSLARFWSRRARRLLPALLLTVLGVVVLSHTITVADDTRSGLLGGLTYSANWVLLADGQSYAELFRAPSPVTHLWSLAIEEQFYVLFPLAVWLLVRGARRRPGADEAAADRLRRRLAVGSAVVAVGGLATAWAIDDPAFAYYATPTRAPEIALGVLLACTSQATAPRRSSLAAGFGAGALLVTVAAWRTVELSDRWVGRGGLVAFAVVSAALVSGASRPGWLATAVGWRPLRALGIVSYGVYLVHWPVVVLLDRPRVDLAPFPLFAVRVALTLAAAVASYALVERPIRAGWTPRARPVPARRVVGAGLGAIAAVAVVVLLAVPRVDDAPEVAVAAPALVDPDQPVAATTPGGEGAPTGGADDPPTVLLLGDSVPNWLVRDGAAALDPDRVALIDGTSEGCDGAEGAPVGRAGTGVVVRVPASCTGWRTQYPPVVEARPIDVAVLVIGSGAVLDRQLDGAFHGPCDPTARDWYAADVAARLRYLADHVDEVVLVLPAWAEDWSGWVNPPDHLARTDCVRATLQGEADAATAAGTPVTVVDLAAELCPDGPGACRPVRETDGVHVDPTEAGAVLTWVLDQAVG